MFKINMFGRGLPLQIAIIVACQLAFILFGYDQGVFSGIVGDENWLNQFNHPNSALEGIIVSIYNLGAFTGCILNFLGGEWSGRRLAMWIAMGWIIIGAILQCTSYSLAQLLIARFITGIGTGIETSTVPMYQAELCDANKRGRLISSEPAFVGVGIVLAYWFDYGMSFVGGQVAWRVPIACQTAFAFMVIVLVAGLPESPRYLCRHGRKAEALQVLCDVYDQNEDSDKVNGELNDIMETLAVERETGEYRWSQLLKRDDVQTGKRVAMAYGMQFMNQMGGINLVVYYITQVLQDDVGLDRNLSLILGGCVNLMFPIGSLVPSLFLDKMGRRIPMMVGSFLLAICMMLIAILLSFQGTSIGKTTAEGAVAFFFLYMLIFGGSANCIPWVYVPEILPLHARSKGVAVGISANWLFNFLVVMVTPSLISNLKWKFGVLFMCFNLAFVPTVFFFYPETKNLTLEEMDYLFTPENKVPGTDPGEDVRAGSKMRSWGRTEEVMRSIDPNSAVRSGAALQDMRRRGTLTAERERAKSVGIEEEKVQHVEDKV